MHNIKKNSLAFDRENTLGFVPGFWTQGLQDMMESSGISYVRTSPVSGCEIQSFVLAGLVNDNDGTWSDIEFVGCKGSILIGAVGVENGIGLLMTLRGGEENVNPMVRNGWVFRENGSVELVKVGMVGSVCFRGFVEAGEDKAGCFGILRDYLKHLERRKSSFNETVGVLELVSSIVNTFDEMQGREHFVTDETPQPPEASGGCGVLVTDMSGGDGSELKWKVQYWEDDGVSGNFRVASGNNSSVRGGSVVQLSEVFGDAKGDYLVMNADSDALDIFWEMTRLGNTTQARDLFLNGFESYQIVLADAGGDGSGAYMDNQNLNGVSFVGCYKIVELGIGSSVVRLVIVGREEADVNCALRAMRFWHSKNRGCSVMDLVFMYKLLVRQDIFEAYRNGSDLSEEFLEIMGVLQLAKRTANALTMGVGISDELGGGPVHGLGEFARFLGSGLIGNSGTGLNSRRAMTTRSLLSQGGEDGLSEGSETGSVGIGAPSEGTGYRVEPVPDEVRIDADGDIDEMTELLGSDTLLFILFDTHLSDGLMFRYAVPSTTRLEDTNLIRLTLRDGFEKDGLDGLCSACDNLRDVFPWFVPVVSAFPSWNFSPQDIPGNAGSRTLFRYVAFPTDDQSRPRPGCLLVSDDQSELVIMRSVLTTWWNKGVRSIGNMQRTYRDCRESILTEFHNSPSGRSIADLDSFRGSLIALLGLGAPDPRHLDGEGDGLSSSRGFRPRLAAEGFGGARPRLHTTRGIGNVRAPDQELMHNLVSQTGYNRKAKRIALCWEFILKGLGFSSGNPGGIRIEKLTEAARSVLEWGSQRRSRLLNQMCLENDRLRILAQEMVSSEASGADTNSRFAIYVLRYLSFNSGYDIIPTADSIPLTIPYKYFLSEFFESLDSAGLRCKDTTGSGVRFAGKFAENALGRACEILSAVQNGKAYLDGNSSNPMSLNDFVEEYTTAPGEGRAETARLGESRFGAASRHRTSEVEASARFGEGWVDSSRFGATSFGDSGAGESRLDTARTETFSAEAARDGEGRSEAAKTMGHRFFR